MWQALIFIAIVFILLSIVVEAVKFLIWVGLLVFIVVAILYVLNQIKR